MSKKLVTPKQEPMGPTAIRDVMLDAQKQIQARKQELNFITPTTSAQQRLAELKRGIANQIGQLFTTPTEDRDRPVHVTIDKEGRTIDTFTGEVLQIPSRMPTLKANLRVQKKRCYQTRTTKT